MHPLLCPRNVFRLSLVSSSLVFLACGGSSESAPKTPSAPPAYFGQVLPGETPVPFAPERLGALSLWTETSGFSPDGTLFLASVGSADWSTSKLFLSTYANGAWSAFEEAPFLADFTHSTEPVFAADGKRLLFTGKKGSGPTRLWTVSYANRAWGTPTPLPSPINGEANTWRGSYAQDGAFYFGSERLDPVNGIMGIYRATLDAAQQTVVEPIGAPVTSGAYECDPCIAPDGRFLIFGSYRDGLTSDLYVSFRKAQGGWGDAIKLGPEFNVTRNAVGNGVQEYGAHLSNDGKFLFFTRHTGRGSLQGNQIFWVSVSAIDKLKP